MNNFIAEFPAYSIATPADGHEYKTGDVIALPFDSPRHGTLYRFHQLGTIEGLATSNGEDPAQARSKFEETRNKFPHMGHVPAWGFIRSTMISDTAQEHAIRPGHVIGDTIQLDGRAFEIRKAPNHNIELIEI